MAGSIIWYATIFGCAALFCGIGIYARKTEKAMWFWSGSTVDPSTITDVKAYNAENSRMWLLYSLWYWVAGIAWIWSEAVALIALFLLSAYHKKHLVAIAIKSAYRLCDTRFYFLFTSN